MRSIRVMIVDDEHDARELLSSLLGQYSFIEIVGQAEGTEKALSMLEEVSPDLITVDIHMPFRDGFELVKALKAINHSADIIFTTANNSYAIKAIKYGVFDYWLKPIDQDELYESIVRYQAYRSTVNRYKPTKLTFNTPEGVIKLNASDILYLKNTDKKPDLELSDSSGFTTAIKITADDILTLEKQLGFYRLKNGIIVNPDYVFEINYRKKHLILKASGEYVTLPVQTKKELEWLAGKL